MTVRLFLTGLISLLGQVVLLRELAVAFYGSELVYLLALGGWLFGTAAGAALGRRSHLPDEERVRTLFLAAAWALPLAVVLARGVRPLFGAVPGAYLDPPRQLAALALVLLPVSALLGLLFQAAAKRYVETGRTLARAYAIESAGAAAGGVAATLLLRWGVANLVAVLLCGLAALAAFGWPLSPSPRPRVAALAVTATLLVAALAGSPGLDRALTRWTHPDLVATADSPYGRVTVTQREGLISVFENDALAFETQGTAAEEFVHLAAMQRARVDTVLVLGGGVEGLLRELLEHGPARVDYVELNPVLPRLLHPLLPAAVAASLEAGPVRLTIADPRRFLAGAGNYDLILVGMPEPSSGQANRFYTADFFRLCAARLAPGGVVALRLEGAENLWTPVFTARTAAVHGALAEVFADVVLLPGTTQILLASPAPLDRDPETLGARLRERGVDGRLVDPRYVRYLYTNDRFTEAPARIAAAAAPVNRDVRPVCYRLTLLRWWSRFVPEAGTLGTRGPDWRSPWGWPAAGALLVALAASRRRRTVRMALLAAAAGFVGMVLETAVILRYQTASGVLYQDLGLLLTLFMLGLAAGAAALDRWPRAGRGGPSARTGAALGLLLAALGVFTAWYLGGGTGLARRPAGGAGELAAAGALLAAAGFLVAAVFAYASLRGRPGQRALVGPLYAADLVGGGVGALAATLYLVPVLGLPATALTAAAVALVALILV